MVNAVRSGSYMSVDEKPYYGVKEKELEGANNMFRPYFNKSLMAGADIPAGTVLTREIIFAMRPRMYAGGLPSERFEEVLGKTVTKDLKKFDPITDDILS